MPEVNEAEFRERGDELLRCLEERLTSLGETGSFVGETAGLIERARSLLKENKAAEAVVSYNEALAKVNKAVISIREEPLAWRLFWLEIVCLFVLLLLAYSTYRWPGASLWKDGLVNLSTQTAWFGALGGVTISLYGIYNHIQRRDFDPGYKMWYVCKPIIGGIFGWFVYLIYFIGLISVQGTQGVDVRNPQLPFLIAFLAGFSERFTIKLIDRLMAVLTTWEERPPAPAEKK